MKISLRKSVLVSGPSSSIASQSWIFSWWYYSLQLPSTQPETSHPVIYPALESHWALEIQLNLDLSFLEMFSRIHRSISAMPEQILFYIAPASIVFLYPSLFFKIPDIKDESTFPLYELYC
jgi:hypothetical protein